MSKKSDNEALLALAAQAQLPNYRPAPFVLTEGRGLRVKDADGRSYLDMSGGIAVLSVGHSHPELVRAIAEQAGRLMHVSNLFYNDRAIELALELTRRTHFDRVFFCNSGTEANEALFKLARHYFYDQGQPERIELVSALDSFHGRSLGALSLTGQPKYHKGLKPLVPGVRFVPFNDLSALEAAVTEKTAAVILEPIQAEGGIIVGTDEYLRGARAICDKAGALLFFDEVQTGYGRTGAFLGADHAGVKADGCSFAKGIAGGFPLGAMCVTEKLTDGLPPGTHASTFGGNALACAAGLAVLKILDEEGLIENTKVVGDHLGAQLEAMVADPALPVSEARGRGLLRGLLLDDGVDPRGLWLDLSRRGLLASLAGGQVLRFCPSLTATKAEVDEAIEITRAALRDANKSN